MMKTRVIPVILLKNGRVVQSKKFSRHQVLGSPSVIVGRLSNWLADEVIYIDISRTTSHDLNRDDLNFENNKNILGIISDVSKKSFMPLTVGGGIKTIQDVEDRIICGADKVSINTQAILEPEFIDKCSKIFGSQCIIVSIDVKKVGKEKWEVYSNYGKTPTGLSPCDFAKKMENFGAGEILLNSIDNDGLAVGYDLDIIDKVVRSVNIPVIALGGVGNWDHFKQCIDKTRPSAVAAANIFQYTENSYYNSKIFLQNKGCNVRSASIKKYTKTGD